MAKMEWRSSEELAEQAQAEKIRTEEKAKKEEAQKVLMERMTTNFITSDDVPEEEKELFMNIYNAWQPEQNYLVGDKVKHDGGVFEVIQEHVSQNDWKPTAVPALFKRIYQKVTSEGEEVIPNFVQPIGTHDAYKTGDKVMFEGKVYESTMDGNVWNPLAFPQGWKVVA